ncbi:MAG TPA: hypothetical protein IAA45_09500 [Candidatus Blautia gallistercoris]|uniref:Putative Flagellin Flp1-like domain-containing protein n=1 Tax=Candidatus Blautia gallistercoris TaxID=2838490 RepID=A0A9D2B398_9FIRM|nr:hypothetical protein [Candidatus Blautia gallistercoris]
MKQKTLIHAFLQNTQCIQCIKAYFIYIIPKIVNILVVLIGLVVIFKEQLVSLVKSILSKITEQSNSI